ncbi:hypothetical protein QJS10_CPA09g01286 [Acorus calamus]|uniref:Exo_endo_phos domain-containing protein n=1 Tax=Acorus calamus TaxID=4465 RepID=A0AAV9E814_ACOCL|nr:hypothetical protein QJS10_CPA09g01286 [Acorus calamus]
MASESTSGGIMLAWNDRRWKKVDEREGHFSISVVCEDTISHWTCIWMGVYGPNMEELLPELWADLQANRACWNFPCCIMGDFNVTRFSSDRIREGSISSSMEHFS